MENHLEIIQKSYDKGIDFGKNGINLYENLPDYIINDPDFSKWQLGYENSGSEDKSIKNYLLPSSNMKFIDLGCCLKLMLKGYDKWESEYYGIDISSKTIELLNEFVKRNDLKIGSLYCGSIDKIPFENNFFDIGECIGIFEYFGKEYLINVIKEIHRVMKPDGKFILDIPNIGNPACRIMRLIEEYLERPSEYNLLTNEFEKIIEKYFEIINKDIGNEMIMYYLKCSK